MKSGQRKLSNANPAEVTAAQQRIVAWFAASPSIDFTFNEICTATKTAKTTAKTVIEDLEKRELIKKTVLGRLWRLAANLDSYKFRELKIVLNLDYLFASNVTEFIFNIYPQARTIVLFGSYRKGEDIETSDLDIAVEIPGIKQTKVEEVGVIDVFGFREKVKVNALIFSRETVDLNVFANIANGIVLYGFLEVKPR